MSRQFFSRRCVFPLNELRISGPLQGSIIMLWLSHHLSGAAADAGTPWWVHVLFGYAILAFVVPWLVGGFVDGEWSLRMSIVLGVIGALPMWVASRWLSTTPHSIMMDACRVIIALWVIHLAVATFLQLRTIRRQRAGGPS